MRGTAGPAEDPIEYAEAARTGLAIAPVRVAPFTAWCADEGQQPDSAEARPNTPPIWPPGEIRSHRVAAGPQPAVLVRFGAQIQSVVLQRHPAGTEAQSEHCALAVVLRYVEPAVTRVIDIPVGDPAGVAPSSAGRDRVDRLTSAPVRHTTGDLRNGDARDEVARGPARRNRRAACRSGHRVRVPLRLR